MPKKQAKKTPSAYTKKATAGKKKSAKKAPKKSKKSASRKGGSSAHASTAQAGGSGNGHHYRAQDIQVLEGLEPVRKRPGMYIGSTGTDGLHHLINEIFDNGRDEAMAGHADHIEVALLPASPAGGPDGRVRIADNGRGIPVDKHKQTKVSALETIMTTLHAGGKFGGDGYAKATGGLHGVGASVVNALSTYAKVTVHRDGGTYTQEYNVGKPKARVKKAGTSKETGTVVLFEPDRSVFKDGEFNWKRIVDHMRQQAYLVKEMRVTVIDAREYNGKIHGDKVFYLSELNLEVPSQTFYFEGGLRSLVKHYNENFKPVHKNIFHIEKSISAEDAEEGSEEVFVEVALQYVDDISARIFPFSNNEYNPEGGMHITGFKTALTRGLNAYARKANILKESEDNLTGDDVLEGITVVVSVKLKEIQFEGQTKAKLGSVEARGAVDKAFGEAFSYFLEEHPDDARAIVNKVLLALKARKAAKAAKDSVLRKGALEGLTLPGKLADCQSNSREETELFLVEGDSAGGSSKMGRDRRTQAILPLRGKILNVERARLDRMLSSAEIKALVIGLGTAIGDTFNIEKLRYGKIIIATDADVDGAHIRTLLLTLFYRYFKPLVEEGHIYIAQPPLYKIKQGKEMMYAYTEAEKEKLVGKVAPEEVAEEENDKDEEPAEGGLTQSTMRGAGHAGGSPEGGERADGREQASSAETNKKKKVSIQRYKGLGEMNPDELWETTMNPESRILKQVTIEDAQEADKTFDILMGTDVPARKSFIQTHAKEATVDI